MFFKGIISKASAARNGRLYDEDMEPDSISNPEIEQNNAWQSTTNSPVNNFNQRTRNINWSSNNGCSTNAMIVDNNLKVNY